MLAVENVVQQRMGVLAVYAVDAGDWLGIDGDCER